MYREASIARGGIHSARWREDKLGVLLSRGSDNQDTAVPDWLPRLLAAGAPVIEERSQDDIQRARCAGDLRAISNTCGATRILMWRDWLLLNYRLVLLYHGGWLSIGLVFGHVGQLIASDVGVGG